ncbi:MAG: hypothetical protein KA170_14365 [Candidatus Promineofilum sp.]|nr:hypothetical protein [Promineifilum sp.]
MKRLTLFVLLLIAALTVAGCGLVATGDQAAERAAEIAQFELPAGFSPEAGVSLAGTTMVTYSHSDGRSHIFLIQAPESSGMTAAQLEQSLRDSLASSQAAGAVEMQDTEEIPLTIRGEQVTGLLGTGQSSNDNTSYSAMTVPFTGDGGPALLMIQRPTDSWDQAEVDAFLASFE